MNNPALTDPSGIQDWLANDALAGPFFPIHAAVLT